MSAAAALARGRSAAEKLMVDACTITRRGGQTTDQNTGRVTATSTSLYEGKCRVQQSAAQARQNNAAAAEILLLRLEVQLPMSVTGLKVGDVVTITASAYDADLVGRQFRIRDLAHKTHATARRVQVDEVTG